MVGVAAIRTPRTGSRRRRPSAAATTGPGRPDSRDPDHLLLCRCGEPGGVRGNDRHLLVGIAATARTGRGPYAGVAAAGADRGLRLGVGLLSRALTGVGGGHPGSGARGHSLAGPLGTARASCGAGSAAGRRGRGGRRPGLYPRRAHDHADCGSASDADRRGHLAGVRRPLRFVVAPDDRAARVANADPLLAVVAWIAAVGCVLLIASRIRTPASW